MTETERNLWVGIFVVVSILVLGTLMVWFGEAPDWLGGNEWTLRITDVAGLRGIESGSPINLNGVEIGRVKELEFVDRNRPDYGAEIVARIKDAYVVPQGSLARVYGATLGLGTGHVEIVCPTDDQGPALPRKGASIPGEMHSLIGELVTKDLVSSIQRTIDNIGNFAGAATPVAANLAVLLEQRTVEEVDSPDAQRTANLSTVVERIDHLVENLNVVLGDVRLQEDVKGVVTDLRQAATDLKETVDHWKVASREITTNLNDGIDRTERNLDQSFTKFNHVLDNLDDGARSLAATMQRVAEGEGTAGLLVHDERLYEAAVVSFERLSDVLIRLQNILAKIERDGYVTVGLAPGGIIKKRYPIETDARVTSGRTP